MPFAPEFGTYPYGEVDFSLTVSLEIIRCGQFLFDGALSLQLYGHLISHIPCPQHMKGLVL